MLVSLRAWLPLWEGKQVQVHIKADSMAALAAASALKGKKGVGLILRELALLYASGPFAPALTSHIPGITNTLADYISRWFEPGHGQELPLPLQAAGIIRTEVPVRRRSYYLALAGASGQRKA